MKSTVLLARTFFARFFESDLMPSGLPQVQLMIWGLALLAGPGLFLPVSFTITYTSAVERGESIVEAMLLHRLLFITMTMTAIGLVALVIWDGVFPDRRDARILTSLPVPHRVLVTGRLLALTALCGLFLIGVNAGPTVIYGTAVGMFGGSSGLARGILAHFVASSLAGVFVFTSLVALQGVVLNVGGRTSADRLSLAMQVTFVIVLLQMIFFMPRMGPVLLRGLDRGWVQAIPSVWFLGLNDVVGGKAVPGAARLAWTALAATGLSTCAAIGLFVATHRRLSKRALETPPIEGRFELISKSAAAVMRWLGGLGVGKAAFDFTLRTLARARSHRLLMAMYIGVALAFVASALVPMVVRVGMEGFHTPTIETLSAPFFLSFFSLVGIRVAMAIPVEPKASWAVRLGEPTNRGAAVDGVRKAMIVLGVLPSVVLAAATALVLWSVRAAVMHAFVALVMGWLLTELLLMRFPKLPFTCTYFPGNSKIRTLWPLYLIVFTNYTLTTAAFEWSMLRRFSLRPFLIFVVVTMGAILVLTIRRHVNLRALERFRFEEEDPEGTFAGFSLSEGFAATPEESRILR